MTTDQSEAKRIGVPRIRVSIAMQTRASVSRSETTVSEAVISA